jgi:hypothetical protein
MSQLAGNNTLTGTIPTEVGRLYNLSSLSLSFNNLQGTVPTSFAALVNLGMLSFVLLKLVLNLTIVDPHRNDLLLCLETLDLSYNNLTGNLTAIFCDQDLGITIYIFSADCKTDGKVECSCCTCD